MVHAYLYCLSLSAARPTMNDLIGTRSKGSGLGRLQIIMHITASPHYKCLDFARKLLNDETTVQKLLKDYNNDDDMFIREVLGNWISRNDDDPDDPAVSRTWEALAQCIEDADLEGALAKAIRDTFC